MAILPAAALPVANFAVVVTAAASPEYLFGAAFYLSFYFAATAMCCRWFMLDRRFDDRSKLQSRFYDRHRYAIVQLIRLWEVDHTGNPRAHKYPAVFACSPRGVVSMGNCQLSMALKTEGVWRIRAAS